MAKYEIRIRIDYAFGYTISNASKALPIDVQKEPYDNFSKRFKKLTYKPRYKQEGNYEASDYTLYIINNDYLFYNYILYFYNPSKKIVSVDVYSKIDDQKNYYPLVFGFNHEGSKDTSYYTYNYLYYNGRWTGVIGENGLFREEDLITRLLEELGRYVRGRDKKFVIKLEKKTDETEIKYPKTGVNSEKITLTKSDSSGHDGYEKYEHGINSNSNVEAFYVSYNSNSVYFQRASSSNSIFLSSVDVYFEKEGFKNLVLIVFHCRKQGGTYVYKYSDLIGDLRKGSNLAKKLTELDKLQNGLLSILKEESENLKKEITFKNGSGTNKNVSEILENVGEKYKKVTFTPNTEKRQEITFEVYKDKLITLGTKKQINDSLSTVSEKKFIRITVYYNKNEVPLLIEFIGKSNNKNSFKKNKDGNSWTGDTVSKDSDDEVIKKLDQIESEVCREQSVGHGSEGHTSQLADKPPDSQESSKNVIPSVNPATGPKWAMIAGSVAGGLALMGSIGGGGGYWLYKRRSVRNKVLL